MLPVNSLSKSASETPIDRLRKRISPRGAVVVPGDLTYEESRKIWNGDINKRPEGIVFAGGESDVQSALQWAAIEGQKISMRSGGHSIPGKCIDDSGIVIDTSRMKYISVDSQNEIVTAEAGCLLRDFDWETSLHGYAVPAGTVSHTGIAGLTLGGGWGWLSRSHGLTIDSLLSVTGFLSDGTRITASSSQNPDLFWAIRGAGQCFLAATQFTYKLHPISTVFQGTASIPLENTSSVDLLKLALKSSDCPNELSINSYIANGCAMVSLCCTDEVGCRDIIDEIKSFTESNGGTVQNFKQIKYVDMQRGADNLAPHGQGYYVKSSMVVYTEDVLSLLLDAYKNRPEFLNGEGRSQVIGITHLGGAVNNKSCDETAWCNRSTSHTIEVICSWPTTSSSSQVDDTKDWARSAFLKFTSKDPERAEIYSNFASSDPADQLLASWGCNTSRLRRLKAKYDPKNVFRGNVSIEPDCGAIESSSVFDDKAKSKGINETSHSTLSYEGVRKHDIKYRYSEGEVGSEVFNDDFQVEAIDFKLFSEDINEFSKKLGKAMEETGFCVLQNCHEVTGHTAEDYEHVDSQVRKLFESTSITDKQQYAACRPRTASVNQGYFGHKQTSGIHPDLVEGWVFSSPAFDPSVSHKYWPLGPSGDFFSEYVGSHLKLVSPLAKAILLYLGYSDSEAEEWTSDRVSPPQHALRLNYYPPVSKEDAASGAGRLLGHEDVTLFTILPAPRVEGLQILLKDGSWARVRSPPGTIIINTGDYMQRLTNDRLRSTTHRVATPSDLSQIRTSAPINIYLWEHEVITPVVEPAEGVKPYPPVKAINFHTSITEKFYGDGYKESDDN